MVEVAVKLLTVTLVMVAGLVLAARASRAGRPGSGIRISGRHGISKGAVVAVVEVDGRRFLVGAGDQSVALLTELGPATEAEQAGDDDPDASTRSHTPVARVGGALAAVYRQSRRPHGTGPSTIHGPRTGPLDRLRAMTVRTHVRDGALPGEESLVHVQPPPS